MDKWMGTHLNITETLVPLWTFSMASAKSMLTSRTFNLEHRFWFCSWNTCKDFVVTCWTNKQKKNTIHLHSFEPVEWCWWSQWMTTPCIRWLLSRHSQKRLRVSQQHALRSHPELIQFKKKEETFSIKSGAASVSVPHVSAMSSTWLKKKTNNIHFSNIYKKTTHTSITMAPRTDPTKLMDATSLALRRSLAMMAQSTPSFWATRVARLAPPGGCHFLKKKHTKIHLHLGKPP